MRVYRKRRLRSVEEVRKGFGPPAVANVINEVQKPLYNKTKTRDLQKYAFNQGLVTWDQARRLSRIQLIIMIENDIPGETITPEEWARMEAASWDA